MTAVRVSNDEFTQAADLELADPGDGEAIVITGNNQYIEFVTAGAETRTLADPVRAGIVFHMNMLTDGGNCVVTSASAFNQTGNNTWTFTDIGEYVQIRSIQDASGSFEWREIVNDQAAATTV